MRRPLTGTPSRAARRRACVALALTFAALPAATLARRAAPQTQAARAATSAAPGTVAGRVTFADGKPAANVGVALSPYEQGPDRRNVARASTDADGRYRVVNVPAGRYRLQALAGAFFSPEERATGSPFNSGKTVTVGAGEAVEGVDLTLVRGGVITGRVTSAEGKPVVAERVTLVDADQPLRSGPGAWVINPFEFETDDRGVYRLYGVPAGRYLVSVGQDREAGTITVGPAGAQYTRTYHPNATDPAQAKIVELAAGAEARDVDIALADAPKSYQATGKIVDEAGAPVAGVGYGHGALRPDAKTVGAWGSDGSVTGAEGEFTVRNLMPGRYAVFAVNDFGSAPMENYSDAVQFEVTDSDVSGLVVKVHRGASVSGTVAVEGTTDRAVLSRITRLNLSAQVRPAPGAAGDQVSAPSFVSGRVNADGTFRFAGLRPGKVIISAFGSEAHGLTLLGVQRNGADATGGIDVAAGESVTGVRVRMGYGTGIVRGQIDLRDGAQPAALPEGTLLIVFVRRTGAQGPAASASSAEVDSRGRFMIEGLMGGEYELTVRVGRTRAAAGAPQTRRMPTVRQTITVPEGGGETNVNVVFDLSKPPEPNP
ncbi:MAG TPA: carboxypeptidase-like regulatory domain-containing protein [Pyrinomonadaceae bacterium]|jgi:5-hydroxyisourate hydrolase-like protein (transthyretin family)